MMDAQVRGSMEDEWTQAFLPLAAKWLSPAGHIDASAKHSDPSAERLAHASSTCGLRAVASCPVFHIDADCARAGPAGRPSPRPWPLPSPHSERPRRRAVEKAKTHSDLGSEKVKNEKPKR